MTTVDRARPVAPPATNVGPQDVDERPAEEPSEPGRPGGSGRRRRRLVGLGLAVALLAVAGAGLRWWAADTSSETGSTGAGPAVTARVEQGSITATESWDGTLDNGSPFTIGSSAGGTVTRRVDPGATVGRGDVLFRVDEQPVTLLSGLVPMYRDLRPGDTGIDVEQLETNLVGLGYLGFTVDQEYTGSTADAVRVWQEGIGAAVTGTVARGAVVFAPAGGTVDTLRAEVGDIVAPGAPVLDIVGTDKVVDLEAEVADLDLFAVGRTVSVVLPGGDEVTGTVSATRVTEPLAAGPGGMSGGEGEQEAPDDAEPVVRVEIDLGDGAPEELAGTPVDVVVTLDERNDVLLVPVNALLARSAGGYALEVVAGDGTTSLVTVETGLFADGKVEVSAPDIGEGTVVGVAGR